MERKYYKDGVEAPQQKETESGTIYNYNSEANHDMLISDGYELSNEVQKVVPQQITMRQTKLALLAKGMLITIENIIDNMDDKSVEIEWEYSAVTERNSPFVAQMCGILEISEEEADDLFIYASTL